MINYIPTNPTFGEGTYSHEVPVVPGLVVVIRDGHHEGTSVWKADDGNDDRPYVFASHDQGTVRRAERCLLVRGFDADDLPAVPLDELSEVLYGCDLDSRDGLFLFGTDCDDDLGWLSEDAEILWDSDAVNLKIDAESLGDQWQGDEEDLHRFAEILSEETGLRAEAATEAATEVSARNPVPEFQWNRALNRLSQERPNVWR